MEPYLLPPSRGGENVVGFSGIGQVKGQRKRNEADRLRPLQEQFRNRLAAVGTGTLRMSAVTDAPRIKAAHQRQNILAQFSLQPAASVGYAQRTVSFVIRADLRVRFPRRPGKDMQRGVQAASQIRTAADTDERIIILHGNGNRPAITARVTARAHLTLKIRIIIRNQIQLCAPHTIYSDEK